VLLDDDDDDCELRLGDDDDDEEFALDSDVLLALVRLLLEPLSSLDSDVLDCEDVVTFICVELSLLLVDCELVDSAPVLLLELLDDDCDDVLFASVDDDDDCDEDELDIDSPANGLSTIVLVPSPCLYTSF